MTVAQFAVSKRECAVQRSLQTQTTQHWKSKLLPPDILIRSLADRDTCCVWIFVPATGVGPQAMAVLRKFETAPYENYQKACLLGCSFNAAKLRKHDKYHDLAHVAVLASRVFVCARLWCLHLSIQKKKKKRSWKSSVRGRLQLVSEN